MDNDFEVTPSQERFFARIRRTMPDLSFDLEDVKFFCDGSIWLPFTFKDPRPSANGLVDDSIAGFVHIGRRGGFRSGRIWRYDGSCWETDTKVARDFWFTLRLNADHRHRYMA